MKILIKIFFLIYFVSLEFNAQVENVDLIFKAQMIKNDGTDRLTLFNDSFLENVIEGYFLLPQHKVRIKGKMQKGGFSFLDPSVFGVAFGMESLRKDWVKNNFPLIDLEDLTNGVNLGKILSFYIIPEMRDFNDNFIILFFKYAMFNRLNPETHLEPDQSFNIKLFSKKIRIPFGKDTALSFIDKQFKDYHFIFSIERRRDFKKYLDLKSETDFFEAVKESSEKSLLRNNVKIDLTSEFIRLNLNGTINLDFSFDGLESRAKQSPLLKVKSLVDSESGTTISLENPVYAAKLSFPFKLYNSKKGGKYSAYKTSSKIFRSIYNIVIVPISYRNDSLTVDLFLDYSKINIDNIPRWTPIKKRIVLVKGLPLTIDLPKENWTANFTRGGDKYDIYGYSDFEKFINEYLILSFNSIEIEKGN